MSQEKPNYEVVNEFSTLATKIVAKYPEVFNNIEVDKIQCVKITNKEKSKNATSLAQILPVKMPIRLDCPYAWYVIVFYQDWDILTEKHKLLLIARILHEIPQGDEEGKVVACDVKDFKTMCRTFGVDYLTDDSVPHLINDNIKWKLPHTINDNIE